jgi:hypothetical protein
VRGDFLNEKGYFSHVRPKACLCLERGERGYSKVISDLNLNLFLKLFVKFLNDMLYIYRNWELYKCEIKTSHGV